MARQWPPSLLLFECALGFRLLAKMAEGVEESVWCGCLKFCSFVISLDRCAWLPRVGKWRAQGHKCVFLRILARHTGSLGHVHHDIDGVVLWET